MLLIYDCYLIAREIVLENKIRIKEIIELYKDNSTLAYAKLFIGILHKCFKTIPAKVAEDVHF